jgi:hypothetical protein
MSIIQNTNSPIIPPYIKEYILDYYSNTSELFNNIQINSYYLMVIPTPEQIVTLRENFKNKSPYPEEIFLDFYMLQINEVLNLSSKEVINTSYRFVLFLTGAINSSSNNILSQQYLTATYYNISNINIKPTDYVNNILPIVITNEQLIDTSKLLATENNQIFPNSLKYIKLRTIDYLDTLTGEQQPRALCFLKENNLISAGGISLFNINFTATVRTIIGTSLSVLYSVKCLP